MSKKTKFKVTDNVFKTETLFLCGYSPEEMVRELSKYGVENLDIDYFEQATGSMIYCTGEKVDTPFSCVWLGEFKKDPVSIGTASHEIFHLVARICDRKGIPIDVSNNQDETGAYMVDFYMRHFVAKLFNKKPDY